LSLSEQFCSDKMNLLRPYGDFDVTQLGEGFRRIIPIDARYVSVSRMPQPPETPIGPNDKSCLFRYLPISDIYLIHDIKLALEVRLVTKKEPRAKPAKGGQVGPVNNTLASLISQLKICVNGYPGTNEYITYAHLQLLTKVMIIYMRKLVIVNFVIFFHSYCLFGKLCLS
jgi:hypothetical protein